MNDIIRQLKTVRQNKVLNQSELGKKLSLPQSHISNIERGITNPRLITVIEMARVLDQELMLIPRNRVPAVKALLKGEGEQKPIWVIDDEEGA